MDRISLYRKYRPHNFENLVGQDHIKTTLINALKTKQLSQAYIFSGPRGTGKTTSARLMAKAINCENLKDGFEPCDECVFCKGVSNGSLIDVVEMDAASNTGVDDVRFLKEAISFAPSHAKSKVFIIDEFHMLSKSAFNALLKTLEEPPKSVYFILATTELHKIPETIVSRCQNFEFKRISNTDLCSRLEFIAEKESIIFEKSAIEMISKFSNGGMRDAIGVLEQVSLSGNVDEKAVSDFLGITGFEILNAYYETIRKKNTVEALYLCQIIFDSGVDLRQFYHDFINLLREKVMLCFENNILNAVPLYTNLIETFQNAIKEIDAEMPKLSLEMATIKATFDFQNVKEIDFKDLPEFFNLGEENLKKILSSLSKDKTLIEGIMKKDLGVLEGSNNPQAGSVGNINVETKVSNSENNVGTEVVGNSSIQSKLTNSEQNDKTEVVGNNSDEITGNEHDENKVGGVIDKIQNEEKIFFDEKKIKENFQNNSLENNKASDQTREHRKIENKEGLSGLSIEDLKTKWLLVLSHIKTPSIQNSLRSGDLISISDNVLMLKFLSDFHKDVVMKAESLSQIEKSIEEVLNLKLQIKSYVEKTDPLLEIDFKNIQKNAPIVPPSNQSLKPENNTNSSQKIDTNTINSDSKTTQNNSGAGVHNAQNVAHINNSLNSENLIDSNPKTQTNEILNNTSSSITTDEALKIFDGKLI
jgi:DNA polymerase III subunit gamma/tau